MRSGKIKLKSLAWRNLVPLIQYSMSTMTLYTWWMICLLQMCFSTFRAENMITFCDMFPRINVVDLHKERMSYETIQGKHVGCICHVSTLLKKWKLLFLLFNLSKYLGDIHVHSLQNLKSPFLHNNRHTSCSEIS